MRNTNYSFAEAMNMVGNGGFVNREDHPENWYISLNEENNILSLYVEQDGDLFFEEDYAPDLDDIKAQDWYLREKPQPKDKRTPDEIAFDEELLSVKDSLEAMKELMIDETRQEILDSLEMIVNGANEKETLKGFQGWALPFKSNNDGFRPMFTCLDEYIPSIFGIKLNKEEAKAILESLEKEVPLLRNADFIGGK